MNDEPKANDKYVYINTYKYLSAAYISGAYVHATSLQLCTTLWDPSDCSPLGSSACRILQARILEWVAMPSSRGCSRSRDRTRVSCIGRRSIQGTCRGVAGLFISLTFCFSQVWLR